MGSHHVRLLSRIGRAINCISLKAVQSYGNLAPAPFVKCNLCVKAINYSTMQSAAVATPEVSNSSIGPAKMKINSADFHSLFTPGLVYIQELFKQANHELCFAGGAVRDLLMDLKPKDIDFATTATPDEMIALFEKEGIRMINEGGVSHGTVTCRIHDENFEITTLRIDKVTDGRHAEVEFTKDWYLDASRRDLTINSLFLDFQGNVVDYFNGVEDLKNRRVRFVGNATMRIKEDYLRILRYFRFFGRIATDEADFDEEAISAIKSEGYGLTGISGPRLWMEMSQILTGRSIARVVRQMYECGIFPYIGFPADVNIEMLETVYNRTKHLDVNHMTYTSAMLSTESEVLQLEKRNQFSKVERKTALFIVKYRDKIDVNDPSRLKFCQDVLFDIPRHEGRHHDYMMEVLKYIGDFETMKQLQEWTVPHFPISGNMLKDAGVPKGKAVGTVMKLLKEKFKESHYLLSESELLELVPKLLDNLQ